MMDALILKNVYAVINFMITFINAVFALIITLRFRKSKQVIPWLIIMASLFLITITDMLLLQAINFGVKIPQYLNIMKITAYTTMSIGIISYWVIMKKELENRTPIKETMIILTITIITYLITKQLIIASIIMLITGTIPLILMFKGGAISKQWIIITTGFTATLITKIITSELQSDLIIITANSLILTGLIGLNKY